MTSTSDRGRKPERRMRAYYYEFAETGVDAIDDILEQIAIAGKMYHHTDSWCDSDEDNRSCIDMIQDAALKAATDHANLSARCAELLACLENALRNEGIDACLLRDPSFKSKTCGCWRCKARAELSQGRGE